MCSGILSVGCTYLDPLGAAESAVNLGRVVPGDAAREDVDQQAHGQHVPALEGADKSHDAEEQHQEAHRPQLDTRSHADLITAMLRGGGGGIMQTNV